MVELMGVPKVDLKVSPKVVKKAFWTDCRWVVRLVGDWVNSTVDLMVDHSEEVLMVELLVGDWDIRKVALMDKRLASNRTMVFWLVDVQLVQVLVPGTVLVMVPVTVLVLVPVTVLVLVPVTVWFLPTNSVDILN